MMTWSARSVAMRWRRVGAGAGGSPAAAGCWVPSVARTAVGLASAGWAAAPRARMRQRVRVEMANEAASMARAGVAPASATTAPPDAGSDQRGELRPSGGDGVARFEFGIGQQRGDNGVGAGQEQPFASADDHADQDQDGRVRRSGDGRGREGADRRGPHGIGGQHHSPGSPPVAGPSADGKQHRPGDPVCGQHAAE